MLRLHSYSKYIIRSVFSLFVVLFRVSCLQTAAKGGSVDGSAGGSVDGSGKWGRRGGGRPAERDQFRVQQQGFYVRGDLTVDVFQARSLRLGTAAER